MTKKFSKYSPILIYIFSFIIPIFFMIIISVSLKLYPFGEVSSLVADTQIQFVDYIAYLKSVFFGNNDLLYTFSKTIGGDMAGFAFYYLGNPFVYLLLFVPNEKLSMGILFMIILLMGLSSLTFNIMINSIYGTRWSSIIFSTAYAFMGYFVAYFNCILYFNNVFLLPLIILGLYELVTKEKKNFKYIFFLALSIVTNYYIGFMTCIFCALFFVYLMVIKYKSKKEMVKYLKITGYFIASSLFAVLMSSVGLITVLLSLGDQKTSSGLSSIFSFKINFPMRDVFSGLYSLSFNGNISDGLPIIYCSILVVVFVFIYFMNKEISLKEKIASISFIVIMLLSFYLDPLNVIWHGFAHPIGFPYRNSFFLSFLLILMGYKGFILMKQGTRKFHTAIIFAVFIIYSLYMVISDNVYVGRNQIILSGAFIVMILCGIYAICYKREYMYPITFGFFFIFSFDILLNGYYSISRYYIDSDYEKSVISYYENYAEETGEIIDFIENNDKSFYRIDKLFKRSHNDPMYFAYNGLSHFSSCESYQVKLFLGNLGFTANDLWSYYGVEGNTAFADSLLNLKYQITQYDTTAKPYELVSSINNKFIYKNPYALDFAFGSNKAINDINIEKLNHFTYQNAIAKGITGEVYGLFRPVEVKDIVLKNVEKNERIYKRINNDEEAYVEYQLNVDSSDFIYMYFNAPEDQKTSLVVNDCQKLPYFNTYNWSVRETGYFNPGSIVPVRFYLEQDEIEIDSYEFYYENIEELKRWYENASKTRCDVKKVKSSHLLINASVDESSDMLVFSMPYDEGWTVKVDGVPVETKRALDVLLAIDITKGNHVIEMNYMPSGLLVGGIISSITLLIFIVLLIMERIRIRKLLKGE